MPTLRKSRRKMGPLGCRLVLHNGLRRVTPVATSTLNGIKIRILQLMPGCDHANLRWELLTLPHWTHTRLLIGEHAWRCQYYTVELTVDQAIYGPLEGSLGTTVNSQTYRLLVDTGSPTTVDLLVVDERTGHWNQRGRGLINHGYHATTQTESGVVVDILDMKRTIAGEAHFVNGTTALLTFQPAPERVRFANAYDWGARSWYNGNLNFKYRFAAAYAVSIAIAHQQFFEVLVLSPAKCYGFGASGTSVSLLPQELIQKIVTGLLGPTAAPYISPQDYKSPDPLFSVPPGINTDHFQLVFTFNGKNSDAEGVRVLVPMDPFMYTCNPATSSTYAVSGHNFFQAMFIALHKPDLRSFRPITPYIRLAPQRQEDTHLYNLPP
ncbi:hypothetical protein BV20DRAFT_977705 [Pilatotrama ljubarskyi]|nr:hypothetical protein BV20DRAFT_977705 [Pilatotrama ljubarskyi]